MEKKQLNNERMKKARAIIMDAARQNESEGLQNYRQNQTDVQQRIEDKMRKDRLQSAKVYRKTMGIEEPTSIDTLLDEQGDPLSPRAAA